jgi:hypothetical protein
MIEVKRREGTTREFVESGLLDEANRRVFHPLGFYLVADPETGRIVVFAGDAGELTFSDDDLAAAMRRLGEYMRSVGFARLAARYERIGYRVQTLEAAHPFADEKEWRLPDDVYPVVEVPELGEMSEELTRALGGERAAREARNRLLFLLERSTTIQDHVATIATRRLAEDLARVGRALSRLEAAVDEVDGDLFDAGVRRRVDLVLRDERDADGDGRR